MGIKIEITNPFAKPGEEKAQKKKQKNGSSTGKGKVVEVEPDPIVDNCCRICSLGAGALFTGILYTVLNIGYLAFRIEEYKVLFGRRISAGRFSLSGEGNLEDVWKILLVFSMVTAGLSMLFAIVLMFGSCCCGTKAKYPSINKVVIIWCCVTGFSVLVNLAEAIFVTLIPERTVGVSIQGKFQDTKNHLATCWGLTGTYTLFYIYLVIVLISYLRLLKYKGIPKVGNATLKKMHRKLQLHP